MTMPDADIFAGLEAPTVTMPLEDALLLLDVIDLAVCAPDWPHRRAWCDARNAMARKLRELTADRLTT